MVTARIPTFHAKKCPYFTGFHVKVETIFSPRIIDELKNIEISLTSDPFYSQSPQSDPFVVRGLATNKPVRNRESYVRRIESVAR